MILEAMCAVVNRICCTTHKMTENNSECIKIEKTHNDNCNQEYSENSEIIVKITIKPTEKTPSTCNQVCESNSESSKTRQQQQNAKKKWQITNATIVTDKHSNFSNFDELHKRNLSSRTQDPSKVTFKAAKSKNSTKKCSTNNVTTSTSYLPYISYNAKKMQAEINENTIYPLTSTKTDSKYINKRCGKLRKRAMVIFHRCFQTSKK